ncbi:helix-turn-helix transcriptional regulator [Salmonella enterica subsp. enterica serovar Java]|nr:helix-turn-helix transcriptional regulator [Salmonella enterica subsp. enterica serovar Java]
MIGKRLKLLRVKADLSQIELGQLAGLDEETGGSRISQYEREVNEPGFALVRKLAEILDVPEAYFYAVDEDLAVLILQYHQYKKNHPDAILIINQQ